MALLFVLENREARTRIDRAMCYDIFIKIKNWTEIEKPVLRTRTGRYQFLQL